MMPFADPDHDVRADHGREDRGDGRAAVAADRVLDARTPSEASTTESTAAIPDAATTDPRLAGSTPRISRKIA